MHSGEKRGRHPTIAVTQGGGKVKMVPLREILAMTWPDQQPDPVELVEPVIRPWDPLTETYTVCHSISEADQRRAYAIAAALPPGCSYGGDDFRALYAE